MRKIRGNLLTIILCILSTSLLGLRICYISSYNKKVPIARVSTERWQKYIFNDNTYHPYYLKKNLRKVDFFEEYPDIFSPILAMQEEERLQPFIAESNISYYMKPSIFSDKAVKIKEGETCYGLGLPHLYGIRSFPTYDQGWRIVTPYATKASITAYHSNDTASDTYYVRTKDLLKFSRPYFERYRWEPYRINGPGASLDDLISSYLFDYDYKLYNKGYYISPDLFIDKRDAFNITLLITSIILFIIIVFKRIHNFVHIEKVATFTKGQTKRALQIPRGQMARKPEIEVEVDLEAEKNTQKSVDAGHSPWRLDPAFVAQVFVSLLLSPKGVTGDYPINYEDIQIIKNTGMEAIAEINSDKSPVRHVYLKRLVRRDAKGIWTVVGYDPLKVI